MGLQKRINKRFIKKAIWSDYIYQIEAEEKSRWWYEYERERSSKLTSFIKDWVNEMKREINWKLNE
jgi:hypothetical protein